MGATRMSCVRYTVGPFKSPVGVFDLFWGLRVEEVGKGERSVDGEG